MFKNFLSFKEGMTYSFEATTDKHLEERQIVEISPGVRILKLGLVFGANASGKSNLISAFEFLNDFWNKITNSKDQETGITPFLLDNHSWTEPTEFTLTFYVGNKKHIYKLILSKNDVLSETLYHYPGTQPSELFSRRMDKNVSDIRYNPKLKISSVAKDEIAIKCLTNMSFFAAYSMVNLHVPEIEEVISWMKNEYMHCVKPSSRLTQFVEKIMLQESPVKVFVLNFLKQADFNIDNINTENKDQEVPEDIIDILVKSEISNVEKERLKKERSIKVTETTFTHKVVNNAGEENLFQLPGKLQSKGTLRTMGIAGVISRALNRDAFLAIDEIESSLHPKLVEFVIENFLRLSNRAQLLLTTHYDGMLEETDLLRNDNIWFTNKLNDGSTELYSLSDFKGVNRISSLQKAYKYGKFKAIPNI